MDLRLKITLTPRLIELKGRARERIWKYEYILRVSLRDKNDTLSDHFFSGRLFRNFKVFVSLNPEHRNFYFYITHRLTYRLCDDRSNVKNHGAILLYTNASKIIMESLEQKREYFRRYAHGGGGAILFRFFRPDQLSESVKVGRDRSGNVDRPG